VVLQLEEDVPIGQGSDQPEDARDNEGQADRSVDTLSRLVRRDALKELVLTEGSSCEDPAYVRELGNVD